MLPKYANPADKLSTIASEPWKLLSNKVTIVEIAEVVRIKQLEFIDVETEIENQLN